MQVDQSFIKALYDLKRHIERVKSEEDLVSAVLQFLKDFKLVYPVTAFLTTADLNRSVLYGLSEFPSEFLNAIKESLLNLIEEKTGMVLHHRKLKIYVEELEQKKNRGFILDKIAVLPMVLENRLHGAMLVYLDDENALERYLLSMVMSVFQERYFILAKKHQALLYQKIDAINEARDMIYSIINMDDMFSILGDIILKHAKAQMGLVMLYDEASDELRVRSSWNLVDASGGQRLSEFVVDFPYNIDLVQIEGKGNILETVKAGKQIQKFDSVKVPRRMEPDVIDIIIPEMLFIPLQIRAKVLGYLCVIRTNFVKEKISDNDISILETIVSLASASIENNRLYEQTLKEQMTQKDLQLAQNIQQGLQARIIPKMKHFDLSATSVPARMIGGDYYDFFQLSDSRLGLTMTDIVGKGIPAALIMAFFKGIMQSSVFTQSTPENTFSHINNNLCVNKSVKNYIPSVYGILDDSDKSFQYTNAGHENPLYYHAKKDEFSFLAEGGLPLGAMASSEYDGQKIVMKPGDIICLYTDGVTEARNVYQLSYGDERLQELIRNVKDLSAKEIMNKIFEEIFIFSQDVPLHDDFTIIVIKRT